MTRRSLRPQLNQIRAWVRQGRTDAWIAHQLDVPVQQIQSFKREQNLDAETEDTGASFAEVDLRAEDDAAIAAELEAEEKRRREQAEREAQEAAERAAVEAQAAAQAATEAAQAAEAAQASEAGDEEAEAEPAGPTRRRRRGGRTRRRRATAGRSFEGTFDHGEEGYGLWLDPAIVDDPIYAEHWAGHRPIEVTIEEDEIVIRRADGGDSES